MTLTRRSFLTTAAASVSAAALAPGARAASPKLLTAAPANIQLAPEGYAAADLWCFDGQNPGPELRLRQGDILERRFVNGLDQPSSVHWHGIRIDNAMDGVPGLTQDVVPPGGTFDYRFRLPDAGTWWYHSHNRSWEQLARGLYGPLIVDETSPPDIDRDLTLMIDDWRLTETGALMGGFGQMHDNAHGGRLGNFITVNGAELGRIEARRGDRLRLRLINAANARIFDLGWTGLRAWIMALDGMPLEQPLPADQVVLAPAQRADLFADVTGGAADATLFLRHRDTAYALADLTELPGGTDTLRDAPAALPPNPVRQLAAMPETLTDVVMEGGAMGGLQSATYQGEVLGIRELAQRGMVWALNGVAGLTDAPLMRADMGSTHGIRFANRTAFPHGMHLHGHHFRERLPGGGLGPWRDTLLVQPNETREVAFVADNPGKWLLHCHMLGHQAAGMKTWLQVGA